MQMDIDTASGMVFGLLVIVGGLRALRGKTPTAARHQQQPHRKSQVRTPSDKAESKKNVLLQRLRRLALGNNALVDRLITNEQQQHPHASIEEILENVIDRWERDHNR
ncbi:MAG: hypothetical protein U1F34_08970 [Gammaproteobacteria bacterium]